MLVVCSSVGITVREEILAGRVLLRFIHSVTGTHVTARIPMPVFLVNVVIKACIIDVVDACRLTQRTPVAVLARFAIIAHVIGIGKERQTRVGRES